MGTTAWISGETPPLRNRPGVYQRDYNSHATGYGAPLWCYWSGLVWFVGCGDPVEARMTTTPSEYQSLPWRGSDAPWPARAPSVHALIASAGRHRHYAPMEAHA